MPPRAIISDAGGSLSQQQSAFYPKLALKLAKMKLLIAPLVAALLLSSLVRGGAASRTLPDVAFDQYGAIRWEDEKARLDNFAIQLIHDPQHVGYILVFDVTGGCPGEATARATRAKRYLTQYRKVSWNQVVARREGYRDLLSTTLLIVPRSEVLPYATLDSTTAPVDGPLTRACKNKLEKIKKSRW